MWKNVLAWNGWTEGTESPLLRIIFSDSGFPTTAPAPDQLCLYISAAVNQTLTPERLSKGWLQRKVDPCTFGGDVRQRLTIAHNLVELAAMAPMQCVHSHHAPGRPMLPLKMILSIVNTCTVSALRFRDRDTAPRIPQPTCVGMSPQ